MDALCVKVQPVGWLSVQGISFDGTTQTVGMCGMEAQLVSASRFGKEKNVAVVLQFIVGDSLFPVLMADHLTWTVERVRQQWQRNATFPWQVGRGRPVE